MIKIIKSISVLILLICFVPAALAQKQTFKEGIPDLKESKNTFKNPILPGFNPDPSVCRVGDDFYLVTSTFEYFPGVPIYHSTDLANWELIGHALHRPSQLNLDGVKDSKGIYAPTIRYNNGVFYMITTLIGSRLGNFVITATNPSGPWSEPHKIENAPGFDPSLFFDDDGKVYMSASTRPGTRLWHAHNIIWLQELDINTFKLVGERSIIFDAADYYQKGTVLDRDNKNYLNSVEASHVYKKNGYYYHMFAMGGTGHNHAVTMMRSKHIFGPYELDPSSPMLTHRDLPKDHPITATGHADLVDTANGDWWIVYLGKRPNDGIRFMLGRETFISPVDWSETWPIVNSDRTIGKSELIQKKDLSLKPSKNTVNDFRDDFSESKLNLHWTFKRTPRSEWWSLSDKKGRLRLKTRPDKISETTNPSYLGKRLAHFNFLTSTELEFNPESSNEEAGLVIERDINYHVKFVVTKFKGKRVLNLVLRNGPETQDVLIAKTLIKQGPIQLRVIGDGFLYRFSYSTNGKDWVEIKNTIDCRDNNFYKGGRWTGSFVGVYTSSNGESSDNYADFDWFDYRENK